MPSVALGAAPPAPLPSLPRVHWPSLTHTLFRRPHTIPPLTRLYRALPPTIAHSTTTTRCPCPVLCPRTSPTFMASQSPQPTTAAARNRRKPSRMCKVSHAMSAFCRGRSAQSVRRSSSFSRRHPVILPKSPPLAKLMQQYPDIRFWASTNFDGDGDSIPRAKAKKSAGGTDKKNDVNNDGQCVERADGTIVGGIKFGQMREYLNNLLFDLLAAKKATRSLAHIGEHVRGALIHMLEQRYPHIGLCAEHWKAHRLIQGRYQYWAAGPFRDCLVTYDTLDAPEAPPGALPLPPPPAAPSAARKHVADAPLESEHVKRQQLLEDESLIHMSLPPPNTDCFANPEQARDTEVDPAVTGGAPPVQPDMFANIVVDVPPPPPVPAPDGTLPVPSLPPAASSRSSRNKVYTPNPKFFTACNLYSAVYCADVACSEAEYKVEWTRVQADDQDHVKLYEEYANELKNTNPKPTTIPEAAAIVKCILELAAK
ncbi:hypothetical protein B0H10DRAFT_2198150 [Mycena sp. CBHHK59/15]|nr:hypothetical protein B0H10DRAFT_2198150 [Mycena sp. CBHHK59/15]